MNFDEKVNSGLSGLDQKLDYIRMGENVVFRVKHIAYFSYFAEHFLEQMEREHRVVHYISLEKELPFAVEEEYVQVHSMDPSVGFELFTLGVHDIIEQAGEGAIFVFDCLSVLQKVWSTDLMMENFMRVTCPCVTANHSLAWYPILRGVHSYDSVSSIQEASQVFLDIYYSDPSFYITPLKVQNRYHGEMFLPHRVDPDESFHPMTYSTSLSKYYSVLNAAGPGEQMQDSWEDFFATMRVHVANYDVSYENKEQMCRMMMTKDRKIRGLIRKLFTARDYLQVQSRMIGTGMIGGKACGMLLARKIICDFCPKAAVHLEPHDSYYLASDIYYTYIIHNDCWKLWMYQKQNPEDREASNRLREQLLQGTFPETITRQFKRMLDYFGTSPIIVRSSSFLEDGFGNAFAGKYDSVFCVNSGNMEERMAAFEDAVRTVYASTMSPAALEYRRVRGLLKKDEQMAILIQRVSGSRWKQYYFPMAAGVGYSFNSYPWNPKIDPSAGMLRLVAGLGTRAVDRTPGDYSRLVSLNEPYLTTCSNTADRHKYAQHRMDVLNLEDNCLESAPTEKILPFIPSWQQKQVFSHDYDTERMLQDRGIYQQVLFADCDRLIHNEEFIACMQEILQTLQQHYGKAVDIEYTVNISEMDDFQINILQCRPLHTGNNQEIHLPECEEDQTLFHIVKNVMGSSRLCQVDAVVYVDPDAYYHYPYAKKPEIARAIGKINRYYENSGKKILLITPGRIGTSSPELGLPVSYAEISQFFAIMEVAYSKAGYMPELSFGSHMFQDLVEAEILYIACMEKPETIQYDRKQLEKAQEIGTLMLEEEVRSVIKVYDTSSINLTLGMDAIRQEVICGCVN
jgi:hypothetical protein